jgi:hypothetical protein
MEPFSKLQFFVRDNFGSRFDLNCGLGFRRKMKDLKYVSSAELVLFVKTHLEKGTFIGKYEESFVLNLIEEEIRGVLVIDDLLRNVYAEVS